MRCVTWMHGAPSFYAGSDSLPFDQVGYWAILPFCVVVPHYGNPHAGPLLSSITRRYEGLEYKWPSARQLVHPAANTSLELRSAFQGVLVFTMKVASEVGWRSGLLTLCLAWTERSSPRSSLVQTGLVPPNKLLRM